MDCPPPKFLAVSLKTVVVSTEFGQANHIRRSYLRPRGPRTCDDIRESQLMTSCIRGPQTHVQSYVAIFYVHPWNMPGLDLRISITDLQLQICCLPAMEICKAISKLDCLWSQSVPDKSNTRSRSTIDRETIFFGLRIFLGLFHMFQGMTHFKILFTCFPSVWTFQEITKIEIEDYGRRFFDRPLVAKKSRGILNKLPWKNVTNWPRRICDKSS